MVPRSQIDRGAFELYDEFVAFVVANYAHKIVEVGVGSRADVAEKLKSAMPTADVIVTDTRETIISSYDRGNVRAIVDDVFAPSFEAYQNASLIYSLNPPGEMVHALEILAGNIGADLLVKPISDEQDMFYNSNWERVTRQGRTIGWLLRASETIRQS